jgi:hypothetical protein
MLIVMLILPYRRQPVARAADDLEGARYADGLELAPHSRDADGQGVVVYELYVVPKSLEYSP